MRIAIIIEAWQPIWGGGQVHVFEIAKKLVTKHNCKVDIYTMNLKNRTGNIQPEMEKFKNGSLKIIRTGKVRNFYSLKDRIFWINEVIQKIKRVNQKNEYDIIHAQATLPGVPGKILNILLRIPLVYTVHGTNFLDIKKKNIFYFIEKFLFTSIKYSAQISVSRNILKYKNKNIPIIIPNGVDLDKFKCQKKKRQSKNFKILFVGRLEKIKSVDTLIKAIAKIKKQSPQKKIRAHIVGSGREEKSFKKLIKKLKLENIVLLKGKKTNKELIREYCDADLFVLPSKSEGQPLTLLEAWATKLPVIVTDVGDNKYFIKNGINGYLIPPTNHLLLAKKITEAIDNQDLQQLGMNGYKLVRKKYTWDKIAKKTYFLYQDIISKHKTKCQNQR